ncbi:MAG: hypothetical protein ABJ205_05100 [Erythrobacter sp.]|uniref:hypothetical protein n=1 Tax=Erythrobacter sp. TaxID=1042 RepID=UPI003264F916
MRYVLLFLVFLAGLGAFWFLGGEKLLERVTEARVEQALLDNGAPVPLAECMAERLVDTLTIEQLLKLEKLAPQEGEGRLPSSATEAIARFNRVDDPEAVRALAGAGAGCSVSIIGDALKDRF